MSGARWLVGALLVVNVEDAETRRSFTTTPPIEELIADTGIDKMSVEKLRELESARDAGEAEGMRDRKVLPCRYCCTPVVIPQVP